jgi:hypothetical protein
MGCLGAAYMVTSWCNYACFSVGKPGVWMDRVNELQLQLNHFGGYGGRFPSGLLCQGWS